jgi:Mg2+ and Co2+ transporter CorA
MESLTCSDIVFVILSESLNRIEPIVDGFKREAHTLNSIVETISISERTEIIKRGYLAKEMTIELLMETENKLQFFHKIKMDGSKKGANF